MRLQISNTAPPENFSNMFTRGISKPAIDADQYTQECFHRNADTLFRSGRLRVINTIKSLTDHYGESNWDGYGAHPVSASSIEKACELVRTLPKEIRLPNEVDVDPDGEVTLEWYIDPRHTVSACVGDDGNIHFASLIGPEALSGRAPLRRGLPDELIAVIRKLFR